MSLGFRVYLGYIGQKGVYKAKKLQDNNEQNNAAKHKVVAEVVMIANMITANQL